MTDEQPRKDITGETIEDLEAPAQDIDEVSGGNVPTSVEHPSLNFTDGSVHFTADGSV